MTKKRTIALLTAVSITFSPAASVLANAEAIPSEEKQYVIVTEDKEIYDEISEEVMENIAADSSVLEENRIIVAELTESEAVALDAEKNVLVEEDIILSGSTADSFTEEDNTEEEELTAEEAKRRKEEMKRKKREALEQMEEEEETGNKEETECEWNIQAVNAEDTAEETVSRKVKTAVLDSGVDYVTGINLAGYVNFIEGEEELSPIFQDLTGHGTAIAGIISGNGETGIKGINPNAELYSVKVLDGENKAPLSRIIEGIYWCIEQDMNIINMSFGTPVYSKALEQAVKDAYDAGLLMVAAAGNDGEAVEYPAAFPEVMAVAATNPEANISEFSNTGEELDVAAPGEKVRVAAFFDGNQVTHGTSIAAPHVTGAASLLWEKDLTKSNEFIRQLINESAKAIEGTDECGLLDVGYAEQMYDAFAETYQEKESAKGTEIPENTAEAESFEEVNTDETYVEGRWGGTNHQAAVTTVSSGLGFSTAVINIIKQGAVYPDQNKAWKGGHEHPWWHGRWETVSETKVAKPQGEELEVNYVAALEVVTDLALEGGTIKSYMTPEYFHEMNSTIYKALRGELSNLNYNKILSSNTKANRKYFLFGCAIHTITDAFAHSTTNLNEVRIKHDGGGAVGRADLVNHFPDRYDIAVYVTKNVLNCLKNGWVAEGTEVFDGIRKKYKGKDAKVKFKMIKIKPYLKAYACEGAVLDKFNVDNPK